MSINAQITTDTIAGTNIEEVSLNGDLISNILYTDGATPTFTFQGLDNASGILSDLVSYIENLYNFNQSCVYFFKTNINLNTPMDRDWETKTYTASGTARS